VRNAKYATFDESTLPMLFSPIQQAWQSNQTLLIRSALDAGQLSRLVRDAMQAVNPALPVAPVMSLEQASGIVVLPQRIAVIVTGVLGAVGLLLASVGLYGVITYSVYHRSREMGIRLALGGRPADVLGLVMRDGARLAVGGVAVGIVLAAGAARIVAGFLLDVHPLDLLTYSAMSALLVAIALAATYVPARRAAAADPMTALRAE
jgi:ABC-type antimicrobial peptide transport system permease subunit